jgi:rhodanese-related sulfurtransferase
MNLFNLKIPAFLFLIFGLFFSIFTSSVVAELKIETIANGTGAKAEVGMLVSVHYTGKLEDGTVFDSSIPRGQPFKFTLGQRQVIQGWEQGVLGMLVGETRILTIPPELGYGATGAGAVIPPNATLVFDIELLEVSWPPKLRDVTAEQLLDAQKNGSVIIDIRLENEWIETGIIEGAKTITAFTPEGKLHGDFQRKFFKLIKEKDTPLILYCRSGNRTQRLGNALVNQVGLTNVSHLTDGITGWMKDGNKTITYQLKNQ